MFKTKTVREGTSLRILGNNREDNKITLIIDGNSELSPCFHAVHKESGTRLVTHRLGVDNVDEYVNALAGTRMAVVGRDAFYSLIDENPDLREAFSKPLKKMLFPLTARKTTITS